MRDEIACTTSSVDHSSKFCESFVLVGIVFGVVFSVTPVGALSCASADANGGVACETAAAGVLEVSVLAVGLCGVAVAETVAGLAEFVGAVLVDSFFAAVDSATAGLGFLGSARLL